MPFWIATAHYTASTALANSTRAPSPVSFGAGLRAGCCVRQARRAAATSGRSCSAACCVFFSREPRSDQEAAERRAAHRDPRCRQPAAQLGDRQFRLGRQERLDPLTMRREGRALAAADALGLERAPRTPALHQLDHEADAHLELGRSRTARQPRLDRAHDARPQIHRIRSCHPWLASFAQQPV
jgi:hypothetical protein